MYKDIKNGMLITFKNSFILIRLWTVLACSDSDLFDPNPLYFIFFEGKKSGQNLSYPQRWLWLLVQCNRSMIHLKFLIVQVWSREENACSVRWTTTGSRASRRYPKVFPTPFSPLSLECSGDAFFPSGFGIVRWSIFKLMNPLTLANSYKI